MLKRKVLFVGVVLVLVTSWVVTPALASNAQGPPDQLPRRPDLSGVVRFPPQIPQEALKAPLPFPASEGPDVDVYSAGSSAPQNETTVAVDPTNSSHIVAAANDYAGSDGSLGFYSSTDAAQTWSSKLLSKEGYQAAGDPSVAIDGSGRIYVGGLHFNRTGNEENAIFVHTSTDGGETFTTRTVVSSTDGSPQGGGVFYDKPYLTVHSTGTVYVSLTRFVYDAGGNLQEAKILLSYSTGGNFSAPVIISDTSFNQGSVPVVHGGRLYIAWLKYPATLFESYQIRIDSASIDATGALSSGFGNDVVVQGINPIPDPLSGSSFRVNSFPTMAAHPTSNAIYIAYAADPPGGDEADIFFTKSTNGGASWDTPIRVNDDITTNDQFFPWLAVDDYVHVVFYDRRDDANDKAFHTYYALSTDGGNSFWRNIRVSDRSSEPSGRDQFRGQFIGDYNGIAASNAYAYPAFMAYRTIGGKGPKLLDQEVYSDRIARPAPYAVLISPSNQSGSGSPGDTVSYSFTVTNTGTNADTYTLNISGNSWPTTVSAVTTGSLAPGGSVTITVTVAIPSDANGSDAATLTASSLNASGTATITTKVKKGGPPPGKGP